MYFEKSPTYTTPIQFLKSPTYTTPTSVYSTSIFIGSIISTGLQVYLDANNITSYPGTGAVWYDLSGNANNVTMQNPENITYSSSNGGYFTLTNTGYFYNGTTINLPFQSSPYTLCAWIQLGSSWSTNGIISIGSSFGTPYTVNAFRTNSTNGLENYWWGDDYAVGISLSPTTQWFNCVAQWDGTNRSIWLNGVQIGTQLATGINVTTNILQIGATAIDKFNEYLQGNIGQVLIYDRALSSTEILQNYTAIRLRYK